MSSGSQLNSTMDSDSDCSGASADTRERSLYCLALVDTETGLPQRIATELEAELVGRTLYKDAANSSLPCLRTVSESMSDSDSGTPRSVGQLAKHGGPCQHCGTAAVGFQNSWQQSNPSL